MISLSIEGGIATVTLCRPPVNAINEEWVARLNEILEQGGARGQREAARNGGNADARAAVSGQAVLAKR